MEKKRALVILCMVTIGLFIFSSCEQSTSTELVESFESVHEVSPVPGADNVTMELERGENIDSFFSVNLDGNIQQEGWCVEWNENASFGLNKGTKIYSTRGKPAWSDVNYFMSILDDLREEDPDLTFREIQVIIWSLIDRPEFDVDKIHEYDNISERIFKDGEPLFDVDKVKEILKKIRDFLKNGNGDEKEGDGVYLIENDGQTIMVKSETAYAVKTDNNEVDSSASKCFDEEIIPGVSFNNWGWTNGPIAPGTEETVYDIYAGAGQCDLTKGVHVGTLTVEYINGTFTATYEMTEISPITNALYTMTETHLYVGTDPYPQNPGGNYTVAPGQYGNQQNHNFATETTYEISGLSGNVYFIAHAVVNGFELNGN
ncbi:hypothetical protein ACG2F4_19195 [Halalkalibaculum sp. DA3122]|uniref:hypothetical protein n=1 Tax=unclassified Halalkalibaculum TaxID=2964617 RepID=UPI0037542598